MYAGAIRRSGQMTDTNLLRRIERARRENIHVSPVDDKMKEYDVLGSSGNNYSVSLISNSCTCPDYNRRKLPCKHVFKCVMYEHSKATYSQLSSECCICYGTHPGFAWTCPTCNNSMHHACVQLWFESNGRQTCPMCRSICGDDLYNTFYRMNLFAQGNDA